VRRLLETLVVDKTALISLADSRQNSFHLHLWMESATLTYATDDIRLDMADFFRKLVVRNEMTRHSALAVCDKALRLIDHFVSTGALWQEALVEAPGFRVSTVDMAPIILARKISAGFLCLNENHRFIAEELGIQVYW
jgi:predicted nucleic acid-binding protein